MRIKNLQTPCRMMEWRFPMCDANAAAQHATFRIVR
jgi:hypothetical protein